MDNAKGQCFSFSHRFCHISTKANGSRMLSKCYNDTDGNEWQIKVYPAGRNCEVCGIEFHLARTISQTLDIRFAPFFRFLLNAFIFECMP